MSDRDHSSVAATPRSEPPVMSGRVTSASSSRPTSGAASPESTTAVVNPPTRVLRDQPSSSCIGTSSTENA